MAHSTRPQLASAPNMADLNRAELITALAAVRASCSVPAPVTRHSSSLVAPSPSAASFREELIRRGWTVYRAENEVLSGIRRTAELLRAGQLVICSPCEDAIREFGLYRWDTAATGDRVVKEHDHAMDDIRYFAVTVASRRSEGFFAGAVERSG